MKHSKQTRLTAALFAAAVSTAVGGNSAAAAFSPEEQRIAAILYGPPPVMDKAGDLDKNSILDARDVTLLKRELMSSGNGADAMELRHLTYGQADYSAAKDYNNDQVVSKADVRTMLNRMTGNQLPASFTALVYPVAYLSTEIPPFAEEISTEEKENLVYRLSCMLDSPYRITVQTDSSKWTEATNVYLSPGSPVPIYLDHFAEIPEKNNTDVVKKALITFERIRPAATDITAPVLPERFEIEFSYVTCAKDATGKITYYDTGLIEYNMLAGTCTYGPKFEPNQTVIEPESVVEQTDLLADALQKELERRGLTEPEETPEESQTGEA